MPKPHTTTACMLPACRNPSPPHPPSSCLRKLSKPVAVCRMWYAVRSSLASTSLLHLHPISAPLLLLPPHGQVRPGSFCHSKQSLIPRLPPRHKRSPTADALLQPVVGLGGEGREGGSTSSHRPHSCPQKLDGPRHRGPHVGHVCQHLVRKRWTCGVLCPYILTY